MAFLSLLGTAAHTTTGRAHVVHVHQRLVDAACADVAALYEQLHTQAAGLSQEEAEKRLDEHGPNVVAREQRQTFLGRLVDNVKNPLVILLSVLAVVSYLTGDLRATVMISVMVLLGVVLRFVQETRADEAATKLKAMVSTTATALRDGARKEVPLKELVPGDVITLAAGDMVPADVRMFSAKDLFLNQAALTGESLPVEKVATTVMGGEASNPLEMPNVAFLGSNVQTGTGMAVVVLTGKDTYFGSLASSIVGQRVLTSFDKGVNSITWLMIGFIAFMVPAVFVINGLTKGDWLQAFLFALAVAVGLTPEMLPMIVTVNLSKGAIAMSAKKVIVKRLNSIQNFGAMDVLCTDKTGTITQGKIVLEKHLDIQGHESERPLRFGFLNSFYQTGLKNLMDVAVLNHVDLGQQLILEKGYHKLDEIPFDFERRRMSVVVEDKDGRHLLICKGAVEELEGLCTRVEIGEQSVELTEEYKVQAREVVRKLNGDGFRVITIGYKEVPNHVKTTVYSTRDECDLTLLGFLAFLDPPKETTREALDRLARLNVKVKILTGDNDLVTVSICRQVGLPVDQVLLGPAIEGLSDHDLACAAEETTVFAKLAPAHKERLIHALQLKGHVVGFLGDGINDAPALKAADVGISVDSAVDIAKESSDIILLENSLLVLEQGVIEGRKVFGNIIKYIKMAASSNFGNMFSVVGGSAFLPFVPMLPLQVLTNNLLYDFSQTTIPSDGVDAEWLAKPRKWTIGELRRFIIYIGPLSSIFDYLTYFMMLFIFDCWHNPALFHTAWFMESLTTQTLIIHIIRTHKIPFIQSRASTPLILTTIIIVATAGLLTVSPLAPALGFVPLPPLYWLLLGLMVVAYLIITQVVKVWFQRKFGED